ncbi:MAG: repair protein RecN, partial [Frankiaceae bacterium]|nr:repair protein RecN [Frankiaceae bacterium]
MLEELRLRGLGVIDDAEIELGPGFTAITGETGAGKTMLLTGLALLLGARADPGLVRAGHDRLEVEGRVRVDPDGPVSSRAVDAGATLDDGALILARSVSSEGRSRAFVGGRAVPVGVLGELADDLVTVHGQADQRGLL